MDPDSSLMVPDYISIVPDSSLMVPDGNQDPPGNLQESSLFLVACVFTTLLPALFTGEKKQF